jgi:hypothetical protein
MQSNRPGVVALVVPMSAVVAGMPPALWEAMLRRCGPRQVQQLGKVSDTLFFVGRR